jgi:hypothetical protein
MIAAVKGCFASLSALLFLLPIPAPAADDLAGAARELARKTAAFAGRGEAVSVSWRNLSSLPEGDFTRARTVFETALREAAIKLTDVATSVEMRITLSESVSQFLLIGEVRKGDDRQTLMASWKRTTAAPADGVTLERRLLWEQPEPILDVTVTPNGVLVLSPSRLALYEGREEKSAVPVTPARPWPRDPRARLLPTGSALRAWLPGTLCVGTLEPALTLDCRASDEPWPLDAATRATFAPGRNYFDGHVTGIRKALPPFYTAVSANDQGRTLWLLALTDGRTQIFDANFDPAGAVGGWGSDLAATAARCAQTSQILATRASDARESDSIRVYALVNRTPVALSSPLDFTGPVTALWSAGGPSAIAVVRDLETGRYSAFLLTVVCGA